MVWTRWCGGIVQSNDKVEMVCWWWWGWFVGRFYASGDLMLRDIWYWWLIECQRCFEHTKHGLHVIVYRLILAVPRICIQGYPFMGRVPCVLVSFANGDLVPLGRGRCPVGTQCVVGFTCTSPAP